MSINLPKFNETRETKNGRREIGFRNLRFPVYCLKLSPAFSLIELMIVVSLFTLVAVVVSVSYVGFQGREEVKSAALQVKNDLRYAFNRAKTGDKVANVSPPGGCFTPTLASPTPQPVSNTLVGWYVKFDKTTGNNTSYQVAGNCLTGDCSTSCLEKKFGATTYKLPKDVTVTQITINKDDPEPDLNPDVVNILFRPLDLGVSFHGSGSTTAPGDGNDLVFIDETAGTLVNEMSGSEAIITLTSAGNSYEIHISPLGKVEEVRL